MTTGSILFDREFRFQDGAIGEKLFVLLNDGTVGYYIVVPTTSQQHNKGKRPGCQPADFPCNFYIPEGECDLGKNTWVILQKYYEYPSDFAELFARRQSGRLKFICTLPETLIKQLLNCAKNSQDIEIRYEAIVDDELNKYVL
ncbi:MAG TPA: hypothetical protein VFD58_30565 [Blastocatellia bacterium]|nr:hypothetical protein [Blastocatellia bacterium]